MRKRLKPNEAELLGFEPKPNLPDGNVLEIYKHRGHVRLQGFREDLVKRCCNGFNTMHKGFRWKFITDEEFLIYQSIPEIDYKVV